MKLEFYAVDDICMVIKIEEMQLLKKYENTIDTAMFYMADHGESLGEGGFYLHGLLYLIAPDTQKHVASVLWLGKNFPVYRENLRQNVSCEFTQDNLFSTLLGLLMFRLESMMKIWIF